MNTRAVDVAESPKTDGYFCEIPHEPCAVVMFGASGDLAKRKLLPALYDLAVHACLAPRFRLIGFARSEMSDDQFRSVTSQAITKKDGPGADESKRNDFVKQFTAESFGGIYIPDFLYFSIRDLFDLPYFALPFGRIVVPVRHPRRVGYGCHR